MPTSATEIIAGFARGESHVRDHAEAVIAAAEAGASLGAVLAMDAAALRAGARAADERYRTGTARPLEGLCLAVKDNIDTAGLPTTCGTGALAGPCARDAAALTRLADLGALVAMKTNLH